MPSRRRPQFYWHASGRKVNSNVHDYWYSLGPSDETIEMGLRWVQVNVPDMKKMTELEMVHVHTQYVTILLVTCVWTASDAFIAKDKIDVLKSHLDRLLR